MHKKRVLLIADRRSDGLKWKFQNEELLEITHLVALHVYPDEWDLFPKGGIYGWTEEQINEARVNPNAAWSGIQPTWVDLSNIDAVVICNSYSFLWNQVGVHSIRSGDLERHLEEHKKPYSYCGPSPDGSFPDITI
jgi:hypothetical protein